MPFSITSHIGKVESLRHGKVYLNSCTLPPPVEGIFKFHIDLRPVKSSLSFIDLKWEVSSLDRMEKGLGCFIPIFVRPDRLFWSGAEFHLIFETEDLHHIINKIDDGTNLIIQLVGTAEDVGIVLGETSDTEKHGEFSGFFMPMNRAQLKVAQWKVSVTP